MEARCDNCVYSKFLNRISQLICRRYPPDHRTEDAGRISYHFPTVNEDEWCGEHRFDQKKAAPQD